MSQYSIEARDCLPFKAGKGQPKPATFDAAMRQFCNYWYNANGYSDDDDYLARMQTLPESENSEDVQTRWWAGRHIGIAHLRVPLKENTTTTHQVDISIRPRFGESFLLAILEDVYNIKVFVQDAADTLSPEWFSSLVNIVRRRIWVDKCAKANRYGLPRTNVRREYQGVVLRGALDVRKTIMPWLLKREVCTSTYEKVLDDKICKIVYEAHRILSKNVVAAGRRKNGKEENGFGFSMPQTVQDTINTLNSQYKGKTFDLTENDYRRIRYKSIYQSWKPLVDFSWAVIRGRQLSYQTSDNQAECVFVDMAEIWEAFLRKRLGESLRADGWRVLSVEECHFEIYKGKFYEREIIPDIILQRGDEYMVFDAKYKRMQGKKTRGKLSDVDRADLFQIHTYIQFVQHRLGKVVLSGLLYPLERDVDTTTFHSAYLFGEAGGDSHIPFIVDGIYCPETSDEVPEDIEKLKQSLNSNIEAMMERIRKIISSPKDI